VDAIVINSVDADGVGGGGRQADHVDSTLGVGIGELEGSDLHDEVLGEGGNTSPLEAEDGGLSSTSVGEGWNGGISSVG